MLPLPLLVVLIAAVGVAVFPAQAQTNPIPVGSQISARDRSSAWASPDGSFAFGFVPDRPGGDAFVAGVFHNLPGAQRAEPVWAAGGGARVSEDSTLRLSPEGSLVLLDPSRDPLPVWSSDTDGLGVRCAALTDAGNLVLLAGGGGGDGGNRSAAAAAAATVVWESFASPTDTLLPGQPLRRPRSLRAASANSIASYYSLAVRSSGEICLVWEDNVTYWSSGRGAGGASEARLDSDGMFALVGPNGSAPWFRLSKDFRDPDVRFRRLRIDADGNLRIYSWDDAASAWRVGWQAVQNQCSVFASCGLYSVCGYGPGGPYCGCLNQDSVVGGGGGGGIGGGGAAACEKMADLANCQKGLSMVDLQQTFLYSLYPPHDLDVMLGMEDCRSYCSNDTGCFAATARNDGSGICTIKRTSFISGYRYPSVQAVSFIKVCLVPQAVSAQVANVPPAEWQQQPVAETVGGWRSYRVTIVVLLLITGFVFLTVEMAVFWFILYKRRRLGAVERRRIPFGKDIGMNVHYSALVRLSLGEVEELTKNFGSKLGPNVYKGVLPNKLMVTVKVLGNVVASERDFQLVASTLGSTHHRNLVALKGFCYETSHKLLLYEYVSNGSLDEWLRKQNKRDGWHQRLNIAIGIARGLAYLHLECKQCIYHGNLKLENVLLDDYLVPKLTNFGLQSLLKQDAASPSETLPERDVFKFGSILLQIVSGKLDISVKKQCCLAYKVCKNGGFSDFVDAQLKGKIEVEDVQRVVRLALWCMQDKPNIRPSIGEVVMVLEGALSLDMPPIPEAYEMVANQSGDQELDIVEILESG